MLKRTQLAPCVHFQPDPDVMSTIWKQAARPSWGGGCEGCVTTLTTTTTIPGLRPCGAPESWEQSQLPTLSQKGALGAKTVSFLPKGFVAAPHEASGTVGSLCQNKGSCAPQKPDLKVCALVAELKMYPELPGSAGEKGNRMHTCSPLAG